jgi:hypothetical protein
MENHFQFVALELGQFVFGGGLQGFFGTGVRALGAIDALIEIEFGLELLVANLGDRNAIRGTIAHA